MKEFLNSPKYRKIVESQGRLEKLMELLHMDAHNAHQELQNTKPDDLKLGYRKRAYVRAAYALIEGVCFGMRQYCESANELDGSCAFTLEELNYILELPDPKTKKVKWIKANEVVKLSFSSCARALRANFQLDCSNEGWRALDRIKGTRDRLAHPKSTGLLLVSANEIEDVIVGTRWFFNEFFRMMTGTPYPGPGNQNHPTNKTHLPRD